MKILNKLFKSGIFFLFTAIGLLTGQSVQYNNLEHIPIGHSKLVLNPQDVSLLCKLTEVKETGGFTVLSGLTNRIEMEYEPIFLMENGHLNFAVWNREADDIICSLNFECPKKNYISFKLSSDFENKEVLVSWYNEEEEGSYKTILTDKSLGELTNEGLVYLGTLYENGKLYYSINFQNEVQLTTPSGQQKNVIGLDIQIDGMEGLDIQGANITFSKIKSNDIKLNLEETSINDPILSSISPNSGRMQDEVFIKGQNMHNVYSVSFNDKLTDFEIIDSYTLKAIVPDMKISGELSLNGQLTTTNFTFIPVCPNPSYISPKYHQDNEQANVIFRWDGTTDGKFHVQYRKLGDTEWTSIYTNNNSIEVTNLESNEWFEARVQTMCKEISGGLSKFTEAQTFRTAWGEATYVSPELLAKISLWAENIENKTKPLSSFLREQSDLNQSEIRHFIQEHEYKINKARNGEDDEGNCACHTLQSDIVNQYMLPWMEEDESLSDDKDESGTRRHRRYHTLIKQGASFFLKARLYTRRTVKEFQSIPGDDAQNSNTASGFDVLYFCVDNDNYPYNDCNCNKDIELNWDFHASLWAEGDYGGPWTKKTHGQAEASMALVTYDVDGTGDVSVVDAGQEAVSLQAGAVWNRDFFSELGELIMNGIILGVSVGIDTSDNAQIVERLDDIKDNVVALIGTPAINRVNSPGEITGSLDRSGHRLLSLRPNIRKVVRLFSQGEVYTRCLGKVAEAKAKSTTSYALSLLVHKDNSEAECCIDAYHAYSLGSVRNEPVTKENLRYVIGTFLTHPNYVWSNFVSEQTGLQLPPLGQNLGDGQVVNRLCPPYDLGGQLPNPGDTEMNLEWEHSSSSVHFFAVYRTDNPNLPDDQWDNVGYTWGNNLNYTDNNIPTLPPLSSKNYWYKIKALKFFNNDIYWSIPTNIMKVTFTNIHALSKHNEEDLKLTEKNKVKNNIDITISPNPVNDFLKLTFSNKSNISLNVIKIYDITGQLLWEKEVNSAEEFIFVKNLLPGAYFLELIGIDKSIFRKFIKQ